MDEAVKERTLNFVVVRQMPVQNGQKPSYAVLNKQSLKQIAVIAWFIPLQQFCAYPSGPQALSGSVLDDLKYAIILIAKGNL